MPQTEEELNRHLFLGAAAVMFGLACGIIGFSGGVAASTGEPKQTVVAASHAVKPAVKPPPAKAPPPTPKAPAPQAPKPVPAPKTQLTPSGLLPFGSEEWLRSRLIEEGLSPDQARGILAMNRVEGGTMDWRSTLGFTMAQVRDFGFGHGSEAHLQAFLNLQWRDMSRRLPGGGIPGVAADGTVFNVDEYLTWIRLRIVGQTGVASDWEGNRQPPAHVYQSHLRAAWDGVVPSYGWGMPGGPDNPN